MSSPRYAPAGLLVERGGERVMIDGGPGAAPKGKVSAWLVTDEWGELRREIRELARRCGVEPRVASYLGRGFAAEPHPVVHTSHDAWGYLIRSAGKRVVWAPEYLEFPAWARGAELMFAEAACWERPILFAGRVGGHAPVLETVRAARARGVRRLVFAHIGRPTLRALDAGKRPPFGDVGEEGKVYSLAPRGSPRRARSGGLFSRTKSSTPCKAHPHPKGKRSKLSSSPAAAD